MRKQWRNILKVLACPSTLTAQQVRFMNLLKSYINQHGSIQIEALNDAPFTSVSYLGIDGVFTPDDVGELVAVLQPFKGGI